MDSVTIDTAVQLIRTHAWIPLVSLLAGAVIRISKNDAAVAWIKFYIKPENRPLWAIAWAIVFAALDRLAVGGTWYDAIVGGLVAGCGAIAGHEIIVNKLRKGRDFGVKKPPPPPVNDWVDDSLRPDPPPGPPSAWPMVHRALDVALMASTIAFVSLLFAGCPGAGKVACPIIDLASKLCPVVLVKLPDGTEEQVSKEGIEIAALRQRAARLKAQREMDAGASDGGPE